MTGQWTGLFGALLNLWSESLEICGKVFCHFSCTTKESITVDSGLKEFIIYLHFKINYTLFIGHTKIYQLFS